MTFIEPKYDGRAIIENMAYESVHVLRRNLDKIESLVKLHSGEFILVVKYLQGNKYEVHTGTQVDNLAKKIIQETNTAHQLLTEML